MSAFLTPSTLPRVMLPPRAPATRRAPMRAAAVSRRAALRLFAALVSVPALPALHVRAEANEQFGYSFDEPGRGWTRSTAELSSFREAVVFINDDDGDSNLSAVGTPVAGDYMKLTSFGSLDNVLDTLIPKGKDVGGKVISSKIDLQNNAYVIEYTIESKGVNRHLLTVFSLQAGRYLVTLTAQAQVQNWENREAVFRDVIRSFKLRALA